MSRWLFRGWRRALGAAAFGLLLVPMASRAENELAVRERRAAGRYASAVAAGERFGRMEEARRTYLDGPDGIAALADAWTASAREYVEEWVRIVALADLQGDLSFEDFQNELTRRLADQTLKLGALRQSLEALRVREQRAAAIMTAPSSASDYPGLEEYAAALTALTQREGELRAGLDEAFTQRDVFLQRASRVDGPSRVILLAKLRGSLLRTARYPLDQTMAAVQALLDAEAVADPLLADLDAARAAMGRYALRSMRFHAERDIRAARARCTTAKATLARLAGPVAYVQAAREQADTHCATLERHYTSASTRLSDGDAVKTYLRVERPKVKRLCTAPTAPSECERLAVLAGLSDEQLGALDEKHLAFVELTFAEALQSAEAKGGAS